MKPSLGSINIDLERLLQTRMLIQANSGAGKSHALRRVLEQTAPLVQQLVIDPEGEFQTLRERFDYIVCAPSGADAVATPKTAAALAVALWRSGSSAVIDIYELQKHERVLFVRRFLEALTAAPKSAWHSTIVALDEIQDYCPETGSSESSGAVVDVAARGRKRGLCLLGATQRIARLSKDCAAELLNKAIGRTGMDVDVRRAMAELGMSNYREAFETLRNLDAGEFFVFGPALSRSVERTKFGPVVTTHPEIGQKALGAPPPASAKVKAQLAKLEGLQREETEKVKTIEGLSAELAKVRKELASKASAAPVIAGVPQKEVDRLLREASAAALQQGISTGRAEMTKTLQEVVRVANGALAGTVTIEARRKTKVADVETKVPSRETKPTPRETKAPVGETRPALRAPRVEVSRQFEIDGEQALSGPEQRILDAIAWLESIGVTEPEQTAVAFMAGYAPGGGSYNNPRGRLNQAGRLQYLTGKRIALTAAGRALARSPGAPGTRRELHERIMAKLGGPERRILEPLLQAFPRAISNADLASAAGYAPGGGSYNNPRGRLRTLGLVEYADGGVRARDILFPEGL